MVRYKRGVKIAGIQAPMAMALVTIKSVYNRFGYEVVVTSGLDGRHSEKSLHYVGRALDIRTRDIRTDAEKQELRAKIAEALTDEFDVVLEATHLHVEFDPK